MKKLIFAFILTLVSVLPVSASPPGAIWLYNAQRDEVLIGYNANARHAIASITKIMTAMVYLDHQKYLNTKIRLGTMNRSNLPRQEWSRKDLLAAMLVRSDNNAAETLAADYPGGREAFIKAMNAKARALKMANTHFEDASGLSSKNISTAGEVSVMVMAASKYEFIRQASVKKQILLDAQHGQRVRTIELPNTNRPLLFEFDNIVVSKTGFTSAAGWCVAMVVENGPDHYVVVVLGSKNKQVRTETVKSILYNHLKDSDVSESQDWQIL